MGERGRNCFLRFPAVSCAFLQFLRLQTTYLADQGPNLQKSAKIFDKLPLLPFSLSRLALPEKYPFFGVLKTVLVANGHFAWGTPAIFVIFVDFRSLRTREKSLVFVRRMPYRNFRRFSSKPPVFGRRQKHRFPKRSFRQHWLIKRYFVRSKGYISCCSRSKVFFWPQFVRVLGFVGHRGFRSLRTQMQHSSERPPPLSHSPEFRRRSAFAKVLVKVP